jgi:hypothetical protein
MICILFPLAESCIELPVDFRTKQRIPNKSPAKISNTKKTFHRPESIEKTVDSDDGIGKEIESAASTVRTDSKAKTQLQQISAIERNLAILGNLSWASMPILVHPQ